LSSPSIEDAAGGVEPRFDAGELRRIEAELARRNPLLVAAADEVDTTLIEWALSLTPFDRLRACSRAAKALTGWRRHAAPDDR
jgi:hypothetical protein